MNSLRRIITGQGRGKKKKRCGRRVDPSCLAEKEKKVGTAWKYASCTVSTGGSGRLVSVSGSRSEKEGKRCRTSDLRAKIQNRFDGGKGGKKKMGQVTFLKTCCERIADALDVKGKGGERKI